MPNPFRNKAEPVLEGTIDAFGHFGCFENGCGRVTGEAKYNEETEMLYFTCPSGHKNEVNIKI